MTASFSRRAGALLSVAAFGALLTAASTASAFDCASPNPSDWPPPAKPYFMIAFDTSGSMNDTVSPAPSCAGGSYTATRLGHARCALSNMIKSYAGEVNFGLAAFARNIRRNGNQTGPDTCGTIGDDLSFNVQGCQLDNLFADTCGGTGTGTAARAANILVPLRQDDYFNTPPTATSNAAELLSWVDNQCTDCKELWSSGYTPLGGLLRDVERYLRTSWAHPSGTPSYNTPLTGTERSCRSVNVILMTDGKESCEPNRSDPTGNAPTAAVAAATALQGGWDIGATHWSAKTYVIAIGGETAVINDTNLIAAAGGTGTARSATNETQLSQALAAIIADSVRPEVCDNTDNNCNGCFDEGHKKWCNRNKTGRSVAYLQTAANPKGPDDCCNGARATCLANFSSSITSANPQGDKYWLPCWDPVATPANPQTNWLCTDPGEACDDQENNCELQIDNTKPNFSTNVVDENQLKCGNPLKCPATETCDNTDQNCDGITDNASGSGVPFSACPNNCQPTAELCNGCDDDCDGIADDGIANIPCGFSPPAQCLGSRACTPVAVPSPGACIPGVSQPGVNRFGNCSATGTQETCNGIDDDCDGVVDDGVTGENQPCVPTPGSPTAGACEQGRNSCINGAFQCIGYIGPATEICDGIDNDCDGLTDGQDPDIVGVGQVCGSGTGLCLKGATACVAGTIVCQGGRQPTPEVCNGLDDDCNGVTDDSLTDAPSNLNCWSGTGTCNPQCSAVGVNWCPPAGATCTTAGTLVGVCKTGGLACESGKWVCRGDQVPNTELCNNVDDDCDGTVDDNLGPPIGGVCGETKPGTPCRAGVLVCVNGVQVCDGQVGPQAEICNGIDDDCDGTIDNGVSAGSACRPDYNRTEYPGPDRVGAECPPGQLRCDGNGNQTCVGGRGPQPEVCDGKDNDCDGAIDESGVAPDGIDGTADPQDPSRVLGASCGDAVGACKNGTLRCDQGRVVCAGNTNIGVEVCDCIDNDCDGRIDEDVDDANPICAGGTTCVEKGPGDCRCAERCGSGEFPCPSGQRCELLGQSGQPDNTGRFCLPLDTCNDCASRTVRASDGAVVCAPEGSQPAGGRPIPECVCKGSNGCREPCFNHPGTCPTGQLCAPRTGDCRTTTNCNFFGCPTGEVCTANRACTDNPCEPNPCEADEVCRPSADFTTSTCVGSCANVTCTGGQACVDGECKDTGCSSSCPTGEYCLSDGTCGPSQCTPDTCQQGEYCNPATGACGANPCEGVACPSGQACSAGQCVVREEPPPPPDGGVGGGTGAGGSGSGATTGSGASTSSGGGTSEPGKKGVFGLATGGGGCSCSVPARDDNRAVPAFLAALALGVAFGARRRTRAAARAEGGAR